MRLDECSARDPWRKAEGPPNERGRSWMPGSPCIKEKGVGGTRTLEEGGPTYGQNPLWTTASSETEPERRNWRRIGPRKNAERQITSNKTTSNNLAHCHRARLVTLLHLTMTATLMKRDYSWLPSKAVPRQRLPHANEDGHEESNELPRSKKRHSISMQEWRKRPRNTLLRYFSPSQS